MTSRYMFLVKMMSMRDKCDLKSGIQIIVVVVVGKHDWGRDQRELRSVKWMVVVVERKGERGSVPIWGVY